MGDAPEGKQECQLCYQTTTLVQCIPCGHQACATCVRRTSRWCAFCKVPIQAARAAGEIHWTLPPVSLDEARAAVEHGRMDLCVHVATQAAADAREIQNPAFGLTVDLWEQRFLDEVAQWRASLHHLQQEKVHRLLDDLLAKHREKMQELRESPEGVAFQVSVLNQPLRQALEVGAASLASLVRHFGWYAGSFEAFKGTLESFREFYNGWHHRPRLRELVEIFIQHDQTLQPAFPPEITPPLQAFLGGSVDMVAIEAVKSRALQWTTTLGVLASRVSAAGDLQTTRAFQGLVQKAVDDLITPYPTRAFLLGEGHPPIIQEGSGARGCWLAVKGLKVLLSQVQQQVYEMEDEDSSSSPPRRKKRGHRVRRSVVKVKRRHRTR